jgi:hypothetical protein
VATIGDLRGFRLVFAIGALTLVAACDESVVERGMVEWGGNPARIEAPSVVTVGARFDVVVTTYGEGCTYLESTDVVVEGNDTVIEPYDSRTITHGDGACPSDIKLIAHNAAMTFDRVGTQTVRVRGRRVISSTDEVIEIPITISIE